jgi:hypothetical protein
MRPSKLRLRFAALSLCMLGALSASLWAEPISGSHSNGVRIGANDRHTLPPEKFVGGRRACIIALVLEGDEVTITVFDSKDRKIGSDKGSRAAVIWYPPRDEEYRIEIVNHAADKARIYVAVK